MPPRANPIALRAISGQITPPIERQVKELVSSVQESEQDMLPWLRKQKRLTELRYAHRKSKRLPWRGAANINTFLIDAAIRKWRPGIASLILDSAPLATMEPQASDDVDAALEAEPFLTSLFLDRMTTAPEVVRLADYIAHRGCGFTREGWDYRTRRQARIVNASQLFQGSVQDFVQAIQQQAVEQGQEPPDPMEIVVNFLAQHYELDPADEDEAFMLATTAQQLINGAEHVQLMSEVIERDIPAWQAIDPIDCLWPPDEQPEDAEFFCIIHRMGEGSLLQRAKNGMFDQSAAVQAAKGGKDGTPRGTIQDDLREEIQDFLRRTQRTTQSANVRTISVWEIYAKLDVNGDGLQERVVLWYAPGTHTILALYNYPYPFETWPITSYVFSGDAAHPLDSRGISEMLASHQRVENEYHNARLNASQILLCPVMKRRASSNPNENTLPWRPGGQITVTQMDDIEPFVHDLRILSALLQEEQTNRRDAETYVGVFDATLTNLQTSRERRTATEVNVIQAVSSSIFGLDAKLFQTSFSRSLTKVWNLYLEFGPPELFMRLRGRPFPQPVRKADIGRNFDIRASGTPANTNRQFQLTNVQQAMQVLMNPAIMQSGLFDVQALIRHWLRLLDLKLAEQILRPPEQSAAASTIMRAAQLGAQELGEDGGGLLV